MSQPTATDAETTADAFDLSTTRACHCLAARKRARALTRLYDRYLRPHGLKSTQFSVLAVLGVRGPTSVTRIGDMLGLDRTSVTRSAGVLERNGWVEEAPADDARKRRLALTAAGRERLEAAYPDWLAAQRLVDEGWDETREQPRSKGSTGSAAGRGRRSGHGSHGAEQGEDT